MPNGCERRRSWTCWRCSIGAGEEARVVGGAVRNSLLGVAHRRHRHRHHGNSGRGGPPGRGRGLQAGADRYRARHRHRRRRRAALRGHHVARGRRDLRAPCDGGLRPRLETRRRAPGFHDERTVGGARRHRLRLCRRARRHRGAARTLHRRCGYPHRRRLSAHPAVLPLPRRLRRRGAGSGRRGRLHRGPRRPRPALARAHPHGAHQAPRRPACGAVARADVGDGIARSRSSAACRCSRASPT